MMATPDPSTNGWLRILHQDVEARLGRVRYVLFDFDGTLSVLRQGWEEVMSAVMVESICGDHAPEPDVEQEVRDYIERSSGILTIHQMEWLAETVQRRGRTDCARTAREYKALYLQRLMVFVRARMQRLTVCEAAFAESVMTGAQAFVMSLAQRGAKLYLASGTDHDDVVREAAALGLLDLFNGGVFGAVDGSEENAKERVIQRILDTYHLRGEALLVVGDGPIEIREGSQRGALTLGVASDEQARSGWNPRKVRRLSDAGADMLVADFTHAERLAALLMDGDQE